jgi:hypothetical protein
MISSIVIILLFIFTLLILGILLVLRTLVWGKDTSCNGGGVCDVTEMAWTYEIFPSKGVSNEDYKRARVIRQDNPEDFIRFCKNCGRIYGSRYFRDERG